MPEIIKISEKDLQEFARFVEELKKDDDAELFSIDKITDPISWGRNGIILNNSKRGVFLIAKEKVRIIGFCNLFKKDDRYECGIGLLSEFRNKGFGTKMIEKLLVKAKNLQIKEV